MGLISGTSLGRYEIEALLGTGGMGEVYRARDTLLDRTVAVKILPAHLADDPQARQRLEREARAISSLNHPNICTLHDLGHQNGIDFLVMECLEGDTLAARLTQGPLPRDEVLKYAIAICEGLGSAHRSGITHRDLKPSNIMLTRSGLKLMDFGLAKTTRGVSPSSDLMTIPGRAASTPLTGEGVIVGTCQYMSPEQIEGHEPDARSDIFALGAVLYEMATGLRAFDGGTTANVIAAVLKHHPAPISTVQPMSPPALDRVVRTCLAKDPDERWHSVHDVRLELQWIAQTGPQGEASARRLEGAAMRWLGWLIAAVMTAAVVFLLVWTSGTSVGLIPVRASILPPQKSAFVPYNFTLSPDGSRLVFVANADDGSTALWIRSMTSGATRQFSDTSGAHFPFWSPDGQWVAFFAEGKLKKLDVNTGAAQALCDAPSGWGGDWNRDGIIVFAGDVAGPLDRVPAAGGVPSPVTKVAQQVSAEGHRWPSFLPDGKHFLYQVGWVSGAGTYIGSIDGGKSTLVSHDFASSVQFASGHLVYVRDGSLMAQPFDPAREQFTGAPISIAPQDVDVERAFSRGNFSVSQAGTLVYLSRTASLPQFEWFDRNGTELGTIGVSGAYEPRISPDGRYVAYSAEPGADGKYSIWARDLVRNTATQLTHGGRDGFPVWSADGKQLVYGGNRGEGFNLYLQNVDGSGQDQVLEKGIFLPPTDWSHDGRYVLYMNIAEGLPRIYAHAVGSRAPETEVVRGSEAQLSPDGRWVAYTADPGEVFVQPFPGPGGRAQLSSAGGAQPRWRADGAELFYIARDKKLMAVSVQTGASLAAGAPHVLFQTRITAARFVYFQYDVTADGQRFLINSLRPENASPPLTLALNWTEALKQ